MATPTFDPSRLTRRGVLTTAAATLLLAACGRDGQADGSATPVDGPQEIVVGASLELSGRGAALGVLQERALRIAQDSLSPDGLPVGNQRRTVRLDIRDNASDPRLAARQAAELVGSAGVHVLVGGVLAEVSTAIMRVAEERRTPFLSLAPGDTVVDPAATERTFFYKLTPDATDVAWRLGRLIRAQGARRVTLVAEAGLHGDSGVRAVPEALRAAGVDLLRTVRLPVGTTGLTRAAEQAVTGAPDAVLVWGTAPDSGTAARALRRAGHDGLFFFDAGAVVEDTLAGRNAEAVEGAFAVHPISLAQSTLTNTTTAALARRDFVFRYIQRHGGFSGFAPYAADALRLVGEAARAAGSVDRGRLNARLQNQVTEGIAGSYVFTPIRHGGMERDSLGEYTVNRGSWVRIS
ncbi:ABC transporter substrate-binding protein [Micromonospora sp. NBRC 101691]|uniref:ABC transporter substrate-binding protein n=1 Tax=Micromonospora sp. NBRC 101691 TaxID=3032198 RepID=UPI0024A0AE19|nr:ABC transporter substrate-binding protein [Micromonospora sp. NBRC 101691]GLY25246.1 branched-chain amino acid ABC transporter [Micromonospora sp. NBRC 101691]